MTLLPSQINTEANRRKVLAAARSYFHQRKGLTAVYEHGHWWLLREHQDRQLTYDVVDVHYGNGFDFEEV